MKKLILLLTALFVLGFTAPSYADYVRYVDLDCSYTDGDGTTTDCDGGSDDAYNSITDVDWSAAETAAATQDVFIYIKRDTSETLTSGDIDIGTGTGGTSSHWIKVTTYGTGAQPLFICDGGGTDGGWDEVFTMRGSYIWLDDFAIDGDDGTTDNFDVAIGTYAQNTYSYQKFTRLTIKDFYNAGVAESNRGINLAGTDYVTVGGSSGMGCTFDDVGSLTADAALISSQSSDYTTVSYNTFTNDDGKGRTFIHFQTSDNLIVEYNHLLKIAGGAEAMIVFKQGCTNSTARFNYIKGAEIGSGVKIQDGAGSWNTNHIYVYGNYIENTERGIGIMDDNTTETTPMDDIFIWANVIVGCKEHALMMQNGDQNNYDNVYFYNNTLYRNNDGEWSQVWYTDVNLDRGDNTDCYVGRNNIFLESRYGSTNDGRAIYAPASAMSTIDYDYNCYYHASGSCDTEGEACWHDNTNDRDLAYVKTNYSQELNITCQDEDPGLTNPAAGDFSISSGASPCVGTGQDVKSTFSLTHADADKVMVSTVDFTSASNFFSTIGMIDNNTEDVGAIDYQADGDGRRILVIQ